MQLSIRNRLKGTIKSIKQGPVSTEVVIDVSGQEMCSVITSSSAERLNLKEGDQIYTLVKATNVMLMKE